MWLPLSGGLYHSTDSGASFTRIGSVESASLVGLGMAAPGATPSAVFVAGRIEGVSGIFRSDDVGATWSRINDDAHQFGTIDVIAGDPRVYGRIYLGSAGRGILYGEIAP